MLLIPRKRRSSHLGEIQTHHTLQQSQEEGHVSKASLTHMMLLAGSWGSKRNLALFHVRAKSQGLFDSFPWPYAVIIFGGALIGYCLARTMMLDPAKVPTLLVPGRLFPTSLCFRTVRWFCHYQGEWFWLRRRLYNICIFMHIYLGISKSRFESYWWWVWYSYFTSVSGIFAVFQFIPAIRRVSHQSPSPDISVDDNSLYVWRGRWFYIASTAIWFLCSWYLQQSAEQLLADARKLQSIWQVSKIIMIWMNQVWWRFECPDFNLRGYSPDHFLCWNGYLQCETNQET